MPAPASWAYAAASVVIHVGYFALVAAAYRAGDMSFAYPLMRGDGAASCDVASGPLIGEYLSLGAWSGVLLICAGVMGMTLVHRRPACCRSDERHCRLWPMPWSSPPTPLSMEPACVCPAMPPPIRCGFSSGTALPLVAWAGLRRRGDLAAHFRSRWHFGLIGGACTLGAYVLALWAMTQAPVALVAALRETSILFGTALSALVLKERFGWTRHAAAAVVVSGAVILKLA